MASEATLATELELRYANISTVDNYAHGIVEEPLAYKDIIEAAAKNQKIGEGAGEGYRGYRMKWLLSRKNPFTCRS